MNQLQNSNFVLRNLVIFDFSGTLSLGAILFAQIEHLITTLKQSGLWQLGLNDPKML